MNEVKCEYVEPITKEEISNLEEKIGFQFDAYFCDFMLKNNAGLPDKNLIDVQGDEEMINNFISLNPDSKYNVFSIYNGNEYMQEQGFIPVARDAGGNYFGICKDDGNIYFWDHEECNDGEEPYYVCEDFQSLIDNLYEEEE